MYVKAFEDYYRRHRSSMMVRSAIEERRAFTVNLKVLFEDVPLKEKIPDLSELVINSPAKMIGCLGLALHQVKYSCRKMAGRSSFLFLFIYLFFFFSSLKCRSWQFFLFFHFYQF